MEGNGRGTPDEGRGDGQSLLPRYGRRHLLRWRRTALAKLLHKGVLEEVSPVIHSFIIDIKDMNPAIYQAYTGKSNQQVIDNLVWLSTHAKHKDKIIIRLPLIPQFNTPEDRERSKQVLKQMGFERFDEFEYICRHEY